MLTRLRWFLYGFLVACAIGFVVVKRARAMKERLDAQGVARVGVSIGADVVEAAGRVLQRSALGAEDDSNG
jgi:hypothetical protein